MASPLRAFLSPQRLRDLARRGLDPRALPPWTSKIIYSSYFEKLSPVQSYKRRIRDKVAVKEDQLKSCIKGSQLTNIPISLRFVEPDLSPDVASTEGEEGAIMEEASTLQFPYRQFQDIYAVPIQNKRRTLKQHPKIQENREESCDWFEDYGTPDPSFPPSDVPCGGCGAFLHCQDTSIPGYTPSERIKRMDKEELRTELCQRCFFLAHHNTALKVNVSAEDYPEILSPIRNKKALVIILVDLLDFPCSLWPGIVDIIGTKRPVMLIGNKVDLLPRDSNSYLSHLIKCLESTAREVGLGDVNLVHTGLISATTGFGVEELIDKIFWNWGFKGDIYLMGCTNVGKSSLFNAFLQSDLCKVKVVDLVQRATISPWPGTTLNLLKFPVTRPESWRMVQRQQRRQVDQRTLAAVEAHRDAELRDTRNPTYATLMGHIGRTFVNPKKLEAAERLKKVRDVFHVNPYARENLSEANVIQNSPGNWDPDDPEFQSGKWCFDTPGAVAENQILDQLTLKELMVTLPKEIIVPRTFSYHPGLSFFVGGLARVDYKAGDYPIRLILFASKYLPVTMVRTEDADEVYREGLGGPVFGVPFGDEARLKEFPEFKGTTFTVTGLHRKVCTADIVISSTGWIGLSIPRNSVVELEVFTPNGKGIFCRMPSFLPNVIGLKGNKLRGSLSYTTPLPFMGPR